MSKKMYRNAEGEIVAKIPVTYEVSDFVEVTVGSLDELDETVEELNMLKSDPESVERIHLGDNPTYVKESYEVNKKLLDDLTDDFLDGLISEGVQGLINDLRKGE